MALWGFSSTRATAHNIVKAHAVLWLMCVNCDRETKTDPATSRSAISLRCWSGPETKGKELVADLVVAVSGWLAILDSSSYYRAEVVVVACHPKVAVKRI
jgi:hypothetical protein